MKKSIIIIVFLIIVVFSGLIIYQKVLLPSDDDSGKFYLDKKYYDKNDFIKVNSKDISRLRKSSYLLFTYNNYCTFPKPCEDVFKEFINNNNIAILSISFDEYKKTYIYKKVKFAPSVIIVKNGDIVGYLDANSDDDLDKYQETFAFENWLEEYIYFSKK